jgi:hypothetical protein
LLILCRVALGKEKILYAADGDLPGNLGKNIIFSLELNFFQEIMIQ